MLPSRTGILGLSAGPLTSCACLWSALLALLSFEYSQPGMFPVQEGRERGAWRCCCVVFACTHIELWPWVRSGLGRKLKMNWLNQELVESSWLNSSGCGFCLRARVLSVSTESHMLWLNRHFFSLHRVLKWDHLNSSTAKGIHEGW